LTFANLHYNYEIINKKFPLNKFQHGFHVSINDKTHANPNNKFMSKGLQMG
jgi:hypothetical protein